MKKLFLALLLIALVAGAFIAGSWYNRRVHPPSRNSALLESGGDHGEELPGAVQMSPEKQQLIGVRVAPVEKKSFSHTIRAFGRVVVDENRVHRLVSPSDGWILEIEGGTTGSLVTRDQVLASFYSGDLSGGQQMLFNALNTLDQYKASNVPEIQVNSIRQQLRLAETGLKAFGMTEAQIKDLKETRKPAPGIEIRSPIAGVILSRNIYPSLRFDRNVELYRIADLRRVWILTDTYGDEASYFRPGQQARITLPDQKKVYSAKVSAVLPLFDPATRTLKVRLEADNPGYTLRPDMLVDVELPIRLPAAITVPVDAVLDSGLKKTVFVDRGNGLFEPREVEIGWRLGNRIEILRGLSPGETIVTSGTFLLDSESRMDLAAAGLSGGLAKDPVTGAEVSIRKAERAGLKNTYRQKVYYFASAENRALFDRDPERYALKPTADASTETGKAKR